jgi:hypothetical protein
LTQVSFGQEIDFMKLQEMNSVVANELEHIPNWPEPQNHLRMVYAALRKNSLGRKARGPKSREEVLRESIAIVKKDSPTWAEQFDRDYFKV